MNPAATIALASVRAPAWLAPLIADYLGALDAIAVDPSDREALERVDLTCLAAWEDAELASLLDRIEGYGAGVEMN